MLMWGDAPEAGLLIVRKRRGRKRGVWVKGARL